MKNNTIINLTLSLIVISFNIHASSKIHLDHADTDISNTTSLQNGAKLFMNYWFYKGLPKHFCTLSINVLARFYTGLCVTLSPLRKRYKQNAIQLFWYRRTRPQSRSTRHKTDASLVQSTQMCHLLRSRSSSTQTTRKTRQEAYCKAAH